MADKIDQPEMADKVVQLEMAVKIDWLEITRTIVMRMPRSCGVSWKTVSPREIYSKIMNDEEGVIRVSL